MKFEEAMTLLREGKKVVNKGWNGKGMWLELQKPDEHSKNTEPYIMMHAPSDRNTGRRFPWLASILDMFSGEWEELQ